MQAKNKAAAQPPLLCVSACFLALAFLGFGCVPIEPSAREPIPPERKTVQAAPSPRTLKRTPPVKTEKLSPAEPAPSVEFEPPPPNLAAIWSEKGEVAYRQEDYALAEKRFREALVHEPGLLHALTGLGWTLYDANRPDEAFFLFRRANRAHPNSGSARRGFAYLLYRYGRTKEAQALLGSLDTKRWPELTNIEDELKARAIKGLPAPRLPTEKGEEKSPENPHPLHKWGRSLPPKALLLNPTSPQNRNQHQRRNQSPRRKPKPRNLRPPSLRPRR